MRYTVALLTLAAAAIAKPMPGGVTAVIAPPAPAPAGCSPSFPGTFEITVVNVTTSAKRDLAERQASGVLTLTLAGGILHDQDGRTGYIASNSQFQFDNPPQAGAIFTAGFSVCANSSLALGGSAVFWQCLSGNFFNLYDTNLGAQCSPVFIEAIGSSGVVSSAPAVTSAATQATEAQPAITSAVTATIVSEKSEGQPIPVTVVSEKSEGQPVETSISERTDGQPIETAVPVSEKPEGQPVETSQAVSQISDGQPQAATAPAVIQISDGQPQAATATAVTQISDGQPQVATATPVTQISDGQPQAATATPVTQISDGQPQAATAPAVTQISDGQPQAATAPAVTQISDGQPQAATAPVVSEKSEGQPVVTSVAIAANNGTVTSPSPPTPEFTGGASPVSVFGGFAAVAAGILGAIAIL